jgi:hypothetical protein
MTIEKDLRECFKTAKKDEERGKKHKGLLVTKPSLELAKEYIEKSKEGLRFCELYKKEGADYKIPEEWYYSLYYCGLAILSKFGVETRSQKCTAIFLRFVKDKGLIEYDDEFINRITVYKEKEKKSNVDEREIARYSSQIKIKEVENQYDKMMGVCKKAISQCEEIIFSNEPLSIPGELLTG